MGVLIVHLLYRKSYFLSLTVANTTYELIIFVPQMTNHSQTVIGNIFYYLRTSSDFNAGEFNSVVISLLVSNFIFM